LDDNRLRALELYVADLETTEIEDFLRFGRALEKDGEVLAQWLRLVPQVPPDDKLLSPVLSRALQSKNASVRAAAASGVARLEMHSLGRHIVPLLSDPDPSVRRAALTAIEPLKQAVPAEVLLTLVTDPDPGTRSASIEALTALREPRVVPLASKALADPLTQSAALGAIAELGGPGEALAVIQLCQGELPESQSIAASRALARWRHQPDVAADLRNQIQSALLDLQGRSGLVVAWQSSGRQSGASLARVRQNILESPPGKENSYSPLWLPASEVGSDAKVTLAADPRTEAVYLAFADVILPAETTVQFLASATGTFHVWLNGKPAYERKESRPFAAESDRFDATLAKGLNRIVIQVASAGQRAEFHLRFRKRSSAADIERLVQAALAGPGDAERGRSVFLDAAKAQCSKCHRIESVGERIGPELTGLGDRFSRMHIIESILEPSRTVTAGFQTVLVRTDDGQTITGIKLSETEQQLVLADQKGDKHTLAKARIEEQMPQTKSLMPDNLGQQLSQEQFVDLVAYLVSQRKEK
jgi:putative heme-binding domain-containing protein